MRVKDETHRAIDLISVEIITKTGKKDVSANAALWTLIKTFRPDIAEKAIKQAVDAGEEVKDEFLGGLV